MSEFKFEIQQVSESDQACVDGVCFVPPVKAIDEADLLDATD